MFTRIRDTHSERSLTSIMNKSPKMTVGICLNTCYDNYLSLAGLEGGDECCECSSRRSKVACKAASGFVTWLF